MGLIESCLDCFRGERAQRQDRVRRYIGDRVPIVRWLPKYSMKTLVSDVIAGLTVGMMVVPQSLAYANIAQVPPQWGLYTSFMGCFVYVVLGTSKDITLGPTAIMSQIIASSVPDESHQKLIPLITLLCGVTQFLVGFLELGALVNFISLPVISGFTSAAAISIAAGQLKHLLGISSPYSHNISRDFLPCMEDTFRYIRHSNVWDIFLGFGCVVLVLVLRYMKSRVELWDYGSSDGQFSPALQQTVARKFLWFITTGRNAVVVVVGALIGAVLVSQNLGDKLKLVGKIESGLPPIINPLAIGNTSFIDAMKYLETSLVVVPMIGFLEAISIAQAFARKNNYCINASQELIAIGTSNILSSFVNAYPSTGSFSRTAVNSQSGVKTPAGGILTGAVVLFSLAFLTSLFYYIPEAALSAIIITAVLYMVNVQILLRMWKLSPWELIPWFVSFAGTLFLGIKYGVLIAVGIHLIFPLYRLANPRYSYKRHGDAVVLKLTSGITYPSIDKLRLILENIQDISKREGCEVSVFILDCGHVSECDFTAIQGFSDLFAKFRNNHIQFILANMQEHVSSALLKAEIPGIYVAPTVDVALSTAGDGVYLASVNIASDDSDSELQINRRRRSSSDN